MAKTLFIDFFKKSFVSIRVKLRRQLQLFKANFFLKNKDFTLFADNCLGGAIYHDFGMQFRSPLINGAFSPEDYIKFLKNPHYYLQQDLVFISNKELLPSFYRKDYPVARLGDIYFRFTHYHVSEEMIRIIWNKRKNRINWDNLYIIMTEKKECTIKHMKEFDSLPYTNKLILTCHHYPELKNAFYVKGFEKIGYIDNLLKDMPGFLHITKRYYDQFDFIAWLNSGKKSNN